jgi:DNA-binding response OmpR family regulator
MLVIVDEREAVLSAYSSGFGEAGVAASQFSPDAFCEWVGEAANADFHAIEGFVLGNCDSRKQFPKMIRGRSQAPVIALSEFQSLEQTLALFDAGMDDVVRKPVHVREILARIQAIRRRASAERERERESGARIRVYFDGRDPLIDDAAFVLPRRERRILEFLAARAGKRVTKTQIFNGIYGIFDDHVDECVVESHVSKLRKKLRHRLGYDPIDSKRYIGYSFDPRELRGS